MQPKEKSSTILFPRQPPKSNCGWTNLEQHCKQLAVGGPDRGFFSKRRIKCRIEKKISARCGPFLNACHFFPHAGQSQPTCLLHLVEKIRSQTQSKLLFLRWSREKKTNRDASSGEIKLKKKKRIVAVSAHAERRLGGRRTANMFSLPCGRSRARTTDKTWEANELFVFLFFFNSSTAVTACRTWTPILSQLLIQVRGRDGRPSRLILFGTPVKTARCYADIPCSAGAAAMILHEPHL